ncbi:PD-(D/E)XK motif protein [Hyphobacterium sp. HN65]|uniref:PD-(D/E)XK motif protein n=1 Tax=Hyphobacterium lacteum TaxID=3116575 RepID=A0ABU7LSD0_9PROT|nr:PD-(D/E)XK motif protein [Hyphobacterium sp. HN65]MEE2526494.1 PD-(D/E)XK motif protein [Hyphobacterium sp. HN65]
MPEIFWGVIRERVQSNGASESSGIDTEPLGCNTRVGPVRIALGDAGAARLLVPVKLEENRFECETGPNLYARLSMLSLDGQPRQFIDLCCNAADLEPIFSDFCEQVCRHLDSGLTGKPAVLKTIEEFRQLFQRENQKSVELSKVLGLLGELSLLNDLLEQNERAAATWLGSGPHRRDFVGTAIAAEVKASVRRGQPIVTISSIDQLEPGTDEELFLVYYRFEEVGGNGLRVSALVEAARENAVDLDHLNKRLEAAGFDNDARAAWDARAFRVVERRMYSVPADFPRLGRDLMIDGQLRPGVSNVKYDLDLDHASEWRLDPPKEQDFLTRLAGATSEA